MISEKMTFGKVSTIREIREHGMPDWVLIGANTCRGLQDNASGLPYCSPLLRTELGTKFVD
jgi:hypothetical protein